MKRPSFKEYLTEYYRYFNSFSEVVDKEDDDLTQVDPEETNDGQKVQKRQRNSDKIEKSDGETDYNPTKFRQWMEISISGD